MEMPRSKCRRKMRIIPGLMTSRNLRTKRHSVKIQRTPAITLMLQHAQVTLIRNAPQPMFPKRVLLLKIEILTNTTKKPLSKSLKSNLSMNKKGKTLSDHTKSSTRLRCAETGNCLANASSKISVLSPMAIMNSIKKYIYPLTIRLSLASNSILPPIALMVIDASSCILSSTFTAARPLTIVAFSMRM